MFVLDANVYLFFFDQILNSRLGLFERLLEFFIEDASCVCQIDDIFSRDHATPDPNTNVVGIYILKFIMVQRVTFGVGAELEAFTDLFIQHLEAFDQSLDFLLTEALPSFMIIFLL